MGVGQHFTWTLGTGRLRFVTGRDVCSDCGHVYCVSLSLVFPPVLSAL